MRSNTVANYDTSTPQPEKSLQRQFGHSYALKKVGNRYMPVRSTSSLASIACSVPRRRHVPIRASWRCSDQTAGGVAAWPGLAMSPAAFDRRSLTVPFVMFLCRPLCAVPESSHRAARLRHPRPTSPMSAWKNTRKPYDANHCRSYDVKKVRHSERPWVDQGKWHEAGKLLGCSVRLGDLHS